MNRNKKNILFSALCLLLLGQYSFAQSDTTAIGSVSFVTTNSIYVKFDNTAMIPVGDTIKIVKGDQLIPCLIVTAKSSLSVVTKSLEGCDLKKEDKVYYNFNSSFFDPVATEQDEKGEESSETRNIFASSTDSSAATESANEINESRQRIHGRVSAAAYSRFSSIDSRSRYRFTGRLTLNVDHIANSNFSLESYVNYNTNVLSGTIIEDYPSQFLRVYNLALVYKPSENTNIILGRRFNRELAALGPVDGLQIEKKFGSFYAGGIAGFRPDFANYSLNTQLFQFGAYAGYRSQGKFLSRTTLGFVQISNSGSIDRRYLNFQHSSTLLKNLSFFGSGQVDLYELDTAQVGSSNMRLTALYAALNYRINSRLRLMLSYDTRNNIIYYSSFNNETVNRLILDDPSRIGLRLRLSARLTKYLNLGGSIGRRSQSDNLSTSNNYNGFITYSRLPWIGGSINASYNLNQSNYLESITYSGRYGRDIIRRKLRADVFFRRLEYRYIERNIQADPQNYYGLQLNYRATNKLSFGMFGEFSTRLNDQTYRINLSIIQRF